MRPAPKKPQPPRPRPGLKPRWPQPGKPRVAPPRAPRAPRERRAEAGSGGLRVWQKLALIPLALLIPVAVLLYLFVNAQRSDIAFSTKELHGTEYLQAMVPLLQNIPQHRGMTNSLLSGDRSFAQRRQQKAAEVDQNFQALLAVDRRYGAQLKTTERLQNMMQDWAQLKDYVTALSPTDAWSTHNRFIERHLLPLVLEVGNNSNLILDPELDSYYLMDLTINILPSLSDDLGRLRGFGSGLIARGQITAEERGELQAILGRVRGLQAEADRALGFAFQNNPSVQQALEQTKTGFDNGSAEVIGTVQSQLLFVERPAVRAADYFRVTTQGVDATFALYSQSLGQLERLLRERIAGLQFTLFASLAVALLILLAAIALVLWLSRQITRPLDELRAASLRLAKGEFDLQIKNRSRDEFGDLAASFQQAATQLKEFVGAQEQERQRAVELQQNVSRFLGVATEIAQGDLTQRGEVTNDVLGNVVDAVNVTVEELSYLLKDVRRAAESVNQGAAQMDQLTVSIASGAQAQAQEVDQVQNQTQLVALSIRQMAESAGSTAQAAQQTLESAQVGRMAVTQTLAGMSDIRAEMQNIAENIAALSRRSSEIEAITKALEDFASQTNLLALNASFEAAGAGAAGRRFAVVAEEIRRLAEESARETARVSGLVQQVQGDIGRVVELVHDGVRGVETGYQVATTAGSRLEEIARLAGQSAGLAQEISSLAQSQVSVVERVDQAVQKIAQTAQRTGGQSQVGRQSAEAMRSLADQLARNLGRFRLPA